MNLRDRKKRYESFHFGLLNILGRFFGVFLLIAGVALFSKGVMVLIGNNYLLEEYSFVSLLVGAFLTIIGYAFLRVKPARPDLDGYIFKSNTKVNKRSWWTGSEK